MIPKKFFSRNYYLSTIVIISTVIILDCFQTFANSLTSVSQQQNYEIERNIVYETVNDYQLKLDVYKNKTPGLHPTLMVIHGGGWIHGNKDDEELFFTPYYLNWGFSVVNINYRLASTALAPGAVEDSLCALNWITENASKYNLDLSKLVLSGFSAGGHLALITGIMADVTKFNQQCPDSKPVKIAAIVNWSGITDVTDLLIGPDKKYFAVQWFGNKISSREVAIAKTISPINFVRPYLSPILTIHGDKDTFVPYSQATRFHQALDKAGVVNQLFTVSGAEHGGYSKSQKKQIYAIIKAFLIKQGIITNGT